MPILVRLCIQFACLSRSGVRAPHLPRQLLFVAWAALRAFDGFGDDAWDGVGFIGDQSDRSGLGIEFNMTRDLLLQAVCYCYYCYIKWQAT